MQMKTGNGHNIEIDRFLEDIKAVVRDGEELLKIGARGVRERAVSGAKTTDKAVREHPYQSIGIMFGLGVLVGILGYALCTRESEMEMD